MVQRFDGGLERQRDEQTHGDRQQMQQEVFQSMDGLVVGRMKVHKLSRWLLPKVYKRGPSAAPHLGFDIIGLDMSRKYLLFISILVNYQC